MTRTKLDSAKGFLFGFLSGNLPDDQRFAFQKYSTFDGYMRNIFKLEVARCKLGRPHFDSWIDEINYNECLRVELGIQSKFKLTVRSYLRNLKIVSLGLNEFSERIIQECRDLKLIGDKIWIWDRRFFECYCSGIKDKETGKLSDPDADHYVKKTGKYSVLTGTGFTDTGFVDHLWGLPTYWGAVGANKNDNTGFLDDCMTSGLL